MTTTAIVRSTPIKMRRLRLCCSIAVVLTVFAVMAMRQHKFVLRYTVNMMYWDQWSIYEPMFFEHQSWWRMFDMQWGPHRQGVGGLLIRAGATLSGWNSRWDSYEVSFTLIAAAAAALPLGVLCGIREPITLVAIPPLFFTLRDYEMFVAASNVSHGAMPVFLIVCYCLCWFIRSSGLRLILLSVFTFCLIFTGFGLFMGLLSPLLLLIELFQRFRSRQPMVGVFASMAMIAASWVLFSYNYHFDPGIPDFHFPYKNPLEYYYFSTGMLSNFYGVTGAVEHPIRTVVFGSFVMLALLAAVIVHGKNLLFNGVLQNRRSVVIFILAGYALLFCVDTAVGRVSQGWQVHSGLWGSRYVIPLLTGGLALFLAIAGQRRQVWGVGLGILYALVLLIGTTRLTSDEWSVVHWMHDGRANWRGAYLATNDEAMADQIAHFTLIGGTRVPVALEYLRSHHLNLFVSRPVVVKPGMSRSN